MRKKNPNKAAATAAIEAVLRVAAPGYAPVKLKTPYLWPDEVVWQCDWPQASTFVVYGPSPKHAGEATIYLCWSRRTRFPEVSVRPSLLLGAGGAAPETQAEGSIMLSDLAPPLPGWLLFEDQITAEQALKPYLDVLRSDGLAFRERLAWHAGQEE